MAVPDDKKAKNKPNTPHTQAEKARPHKSIAAPVTKPANAVLDGAAKKASGKPAASSEKDTSSKKAEKPIPPAAAPEVKTHYHLIDANGFHMPTRHEAIVPISVIAGLIGMLAGTLPASLWVLLFKSSFAPMYALLPVLIWLSLRLFQGFTGRNGFIVAAVATLPGLYLTLLSCQAADHILRFRMSPFNLPLVTAAMIGRSDSLPGTLFSSAYILPIVFTAIGLVVTYELFRYDQHKHAV